MVTDETVEVKVVERAQQKLKLDAMVVQQGRLQEKEKNLSIEELLDSIRFGADKIFRSAKDAKRTDADIHLILEEGKKRTEEMNEKLKAAEIGYMYDFSLGRYRLDNEKHNWYTSVCVCRCCVCMGVVSYAKRANQDADNADDDLENEDPNGVKNVN